MYNYIESPFLPLKRVKAVIVDKRATESIQNKIRAEGINIIETSYCKDLYKAISSHPDILVHPLGGNEIIVAPNIYDEMRIKLKSFKLKVIKGSTFLKSNYPDNIAYNVGRVGKYAIHNFKYTDKEILRKLDEKGIQRIHVEQGYCKCSISIINDNSIITSDKGIAKEGEKYNIEVLLIKPGYIKLPGVDYGFIGGASGLIDKNKILFCGDIRNHCDFKKIENFLETRNVLIDYIEDEELTDFGSIIPILE